MQFQSLSDLMAMGGYGPYVWSAFGITFSALGLMFVVSRRNAALVLKEVKNKMDRQARIDAAKDVENTL